VDLTANIWINKMKKFKSFYEDLTFKVEVEGLPAMYMSGNSPGQVKNHLRKLVKQPSMIKSVKRQTKFDVKKMYRDKAQGKEVDEMTQQSKELPNLKIAIGKSAQSAKDTKARADKRKANKQGTSLAAGTACEATSGEVDYGSDKSVKMMKKVTPNEAQEGKKGLWANIHAKRKRGERMRKKGEKGAPTPAAIKSAQKEDVTEKLTIGKIRKAAYKTAKVLGDVNAVKKGKVARRVKNRVVGKMLGKAVSKLGLFR
jgi:hypothetical protein